MSDFDARFPGGPPSLREATRLAVRGDWTFGRDVEVVGDVELPDTGRPELVADGTRVVPEGL
jgi:UTP--glucose-1-phosphate uridylyltransferase